MFFGANIVTQRSLAREDLPVTTALGVRFGIASGLLLAVLALRREPLRPAAGERLRAALLGIFGYAAEAGVFYLALGRGSAGAVALLFYAYPCLVVLIEVALREVALSVRLLVALGLASLGAVLVVVAGDAISISATGVALALASATCFSVYLVVSNRLIRRSPARATGAWVAGGASLSLLAVGAATVGVSVPRDSVVRLLFSGLTTAAALALLYAALPLLGAGPTAVVMTMEAFVAVLLGAVVLGEAVVAAQVLGGVGILAGAALIATGTTKAPPIP